MSASLIAALGTGLALSGAAHLISRARAATLAKKLTRTLSFPPPAQKGSLRDHIEGALLGAALGEAFGRRARPLALFLTKKKTPTPRSGELPGPMTQLMLASCRAYTSRASFDPRASRREIALLSRYAWSAPRHLLAVSDAQRRGKKSPSQRHPHPVALLVAVPPAVVLHDTPQAAAQIASQAVACTHLHPMVVSAAALLASALSQTLSGRNDPWSDRTRFLLEVLKDTPPSGAEIPLQTIAPLATRPLEESLAFLQRKIDAATALTMAINLAFRFDKAPKDLFKALTKVGPLAPYTGALAGALLGVRHGATIWPKTPRSSTHALLSIHSQRLTRLSAQPATFAQC